MLPAERRLTIENLIRQSGSVAVSEMSQRFQVSEATIRRDLEILERQGSLQKTYGGAVLVADAPYQSQKAVQVRAKEGIARLASGLVQPGEAIFIEASTTNFFLARELRTAPDVLVITNSIDIAATLADAPGASLVVVGGDLRKETAALVGPLAERVLHDIRVHRAFLGVSALCAHRGMSTGSLVEAQLKRAVIACAKQVVGLLDHTKFGLEAFAFVAPTSALDVVVTDAEAPPADVKLLEEQGVTVMLA